jgi:YbbR domain-containing protein
MKRIMQWVASNVGLLLLSLGLALLIWMVAVREENPIDERWFTTPIPIEFQNRPEDMELYNPSQTNVNVAVRAPVSVLEDLQLEDFEAVVDLSGLEEGEHRLPVTVSVDREPALVRDVQPQSISLYLESMVEREVPVDVRLTGSTAVGYVSRRHTIEPLTVTVRGPDSFVAQVVGVSGEISVEGARNDVEREVALQPVDVDGEVVSNVELEPSRVSVVVPVEQLSGYSDLGVVPTIEGEPAPGYRVSSIEVEPSAVKVYGRREVIEALSGVIRTEPLSIEGAQQDIEEEVLLDVPQGISLIEMRDPIVTVRVRITPQEGSLTLELPVQLQGVSQGITATVAPTAVQVILSGPQPILDLLQQEDVRVVVDAR